jgi:hypothetical protein
MALGIVVGLVVVGGVVWFTIRSEESRTRRRRKSWLPNRSGRNEQTWDSDTRLPREGGMSRGVSDDPIDGD